VRRRRRDHDHVRGVGGDHVADASVGEEVQHVRVDGPPAQRGERERRDEARRGRSHEHHDVSALGAKEAQQVDGLERRDGAGDA
jgi:hypothetical protein